MFEKFFNKLRSYAYYIFIIKYLLKYYKNDILPLNSVTNLLSCDNIYNNVGRARVCHCKAGEKHFVCKLYCILVIAGDFINFQMIL